MEFFDEELSYLLDRDYSKEDKISLRKRYSKLIKEIDKQINRENCMICSEPMSSACNSHSVPRFILENISDEGTVTNVNLLNGLVFLDKKDGLNRAGTFRLICKKCDNEVFKYYETTENFNKEINQDMLSQIALKNNLSAYYAKERSQKMQMLMSNTYQANIEKLDLIECLEEIEYAKKSCNGKNSGYYAFYDKELDYNLPIAFQGPLTLYFDLKGNVINNLFNLDPNKKMRQIEIGIFPIGSKTKIVMFIKNGEKTYRNFYKQFNKLSLNDQLHTLFYMIVLYSEFVLYDPKIEEVLLKSKGIIEATNRLPIISSFEKPENLQMNNSDILSKMKEHYDLNERRRVPNLFLKND